MSGSLDLRHDRRAQIDSDDRGLCRALCRAGRHGAGRQRGPVHARLGLCVGLYHCLLGAREQEDAVFRHFAVSGNQNGRAVLHRLHLRLDGSTRRAHQSCAQIGSAAAELRTVVTGGSVPTRALLEAATLHLCKNVLCRYGASELGSVAEASASEIRRSRLGRTYSARI